jgi:hypothetical protein
MVKEDFPRLPLASVLLAELVDDQSAPLTLPIPHSLRAAVVLSAATLGLEV